ncbi:D-cysteine desulfhydrase family protein [Pyruvatibacter mobilis]|uniref:D-cysteine desulfhydrase family protein n=1 Tax=Pyruvatibacter mobilis TaxID=1712261 RepID=UPI003D10B3BD
MDSQFDKISREDLAGPPTPLMEMARFKAALETTGVTCPRLLVKREDLTQTAGGGNKIRKLEYLLADAKANGADVVITAGAVQSNHVRQTAGAASRLGLDCVGLLFSTVPNESDAYRTSGNVLLDDIFGADIRVFPGDANGREVFDEVIGEMVKAGRKAYVIPVGGSSDVGCLGYVRVFRELMEQTARTGGIDHVVVANGSSGTQAGLAAGASLYAPQVMVHGINVLSPDGEKARETTAALAGATMKRAEPDRAMSLSADEIILHEGFLGEGYGMPTPEMVAALQLVARTEGLLLDPVYSGKAMAGLIALIQVGTFAADETVVFMATGGTPGLFAYADALRSPAGQALPA